MDVNFQFDWSAALSSIPQLLTGIPYTLLISFGGLAIGFIIGIIFGLLRISPSAWLRVPAVAYIEIFRGTPVLVQVLFIFYGLPSILGGPIDAVTAGIAAIAVNSGAYISEIVRGGVQSIERGQREAGLSLGLSRRQLERLFKKYLKSVPSRYYLDLRLQKARRMLRDTDQPAGEIALQTGFSSAAHFSTAYRNHFGMTPREERLG